MIIGGTMVSEKRLEYLDYTKGFAILIMLFGHCMSDNNLFHNWIFSFHMPIFFVVCGYLTAMKYGNRKVDFGDFKTS